GLEADEIRLRAWAADAAAAECGEGIAVLAAGSGPGRIEEAQRDRAAAAGRDPGEHAWVETVAAAELAAAAGVAESTMQL
ncbi:hypothetical protein ACETWP_17370, partial [Arthrobacter halodurans]